MHLCSQMAGKSLALTMLLFLLTACRDERLSLPIAHAAGSQAHTGGDRLSDPLTRQGLDGEVSPSPEKIFAAQPGDSCYSFMLRRPKNQRATAVQARLKQADQMAAALDSRTFAVDLVGDHANILSLQFPVIWPEMASYSSSVSKVIEDYLSSPDIEDYLCNSGFAEVRLLARGINDRRIHPIWTARVTSEGVIKVMADGEPLLVDEPISLR
jgi:hypothetical protein